MHQLLRETAERAIRFLDGAAGRHVGGRADRAALTEALGGPLPEGGADPLAVMARLADAADPGLVASAGPRYFGFVTGGSVPVALAADWLTSAWDQNGAMYAMSPAIAVMEEVVARWILEMLDLPRQASVGFVSGAHMANFTGLAAARHEMLRRVGWNVEDDGLQRAPVLRVIVGDEVHISVAGALRMLGIGARELVRVAVDRQGRMRADEVARALAASAGPTIVCAQAGNVATGASDPFEAIVDVAHRHGAWVHVDGAFGLWAAAVPSLAGHVRGLARADSWTTDAHKWLNVPYDSGIAICAHPAPHRAAMSVHASYLERGEDTQRIGMDWVPESSRRGRVVPLYALIRTLGRTGIQSMIARTCALARRMVERLEHADGVRILNDVVLNQVLVRFGGQNDDSTEGRSAGDQQTCDVIARVQSDGTCWAGGAVWQGRQVMRLSISNWSTTEEDIDRSAEAILRCWLGDAAAAPARSS